MSDPNPKFDLPVETPFPPGAALFVQPSQNHSAEWTLVRESNSGRLPAEALAEVEQFEPKSDLELRLQHSVRSLVQALEHLHGQRIEQAVCQIEDSIDSQIETLYRLSVLRRIRREILGPQATTHPPCPGSSDES